MQLIIQGKAKIKDIREATLASYMASLTVLRYK